MAGNLFFVLLIFHEIKILRVAQRTTLNGTLYAHLLLNTNMVTKQVIYDMLIDS